MTNSDSNDDKLSAQEEILEKDDFEKQKASARVLRSKEKLKTQKNVANKPNLKNVVSKSHSPKAKYKQVIDVSEQRITRNKSKALKESHHLIESSKKYDKHNEKLKSSTNNEHAVSPNHSITEYFSSLDLKGDVKDATEEFDKNVDKIKLKEGDLKHQSLLSTAKDVEKSLHAEVKKKMSPGNHKLTEYFPIRRSDRKFTKHMEFEKQMDIEKKIINEMEDGLEIKEFDKKGRGIITTKEFNKGDFVIEYIGDLIDGNTAKQRETKYAKNKRVGCYMYYFKHKDQQYCIDATNESGKLGRLINHSRKGNLTSRIIEVNMIPHIVLFAKVDIPIGTELLYDYGDRNQESIKNHPWLNF